MKKWLRPICSLFIALCFILTAASPSGMIHSEPVTYTDEETRKLLENSLSIVEIDHEIQRISDSLAVMESELTVLQQQLTASRTQIESKQEHAGKIVRAYYMGERNTLLQALFSADSLSHLLTIYDYYQIIIGRDQDVLHAYQAEHRKLEAAKQAIARHTDELASIKDKLISQRERLASLEQEVNTSLGLSSNPEALQKMMDEFTAYWESIGIYEVKRHFRALASAMQDLPQFIQGQQGAITSKGGSYLIEIKEDELNSFLRTRNDIFNNFSFQFDDGVISASGESGSLSLHIEGYYSIVNEPQNAILFHVERLVFNGLELPAATREMLEEEFDLGFYPAKIVSFVKATDVKSVDSKLQVTLKLGR